MHIHCIVTAASIVLASSTHGLAAVNYWDDEVQLNSITSGERSFTGQAVASFPDGRTVVVWSQFPDPTDGSDLGIRARILRPDGSADAPEFLVNTTTQGRQTEAGVAVLDDGRFVVVWTSNEPADGSESCVRARVFKGNGTPASYNGSTQDFIVNTEGAGTQDSPLVAPAGDDGFIVAFRSNANPRTEWQVKTRRFAANLPSGPEGLVNSFIVSARFVQSITRLADGGHVIAWHDVFPHASFPEQNGNNVVARIQNADGTFRTGDFLLGTKPASSPDSSALNQVHVAALAEDGFVAVWTYPNGVGGDGDGNSIRARIFNSNGTPRAVGGSVQDFRVNVVSAQHQNVPHAVGLPDGRFLVIYSSDVDPNGNTINNKVLGRLFRANGKPNGRDFLLKQDAGGGAGAAGVDAPNALALMPDGRVLFVTSTAVIEPPITGRFLDFSEAGATIIGDKQPNVIVGTLAADTLKGGRGADQIYGGHGNDILIGGPGADLLKGGGGGDVLDGGPGPDTLTGGLGGDSFVISDRTDTITDLEPDTDVIEISAAIVPGTVPGALQRRHFVAGPDPVAVRPATFLYNIDTGLLLYDEDGPGGAAPVPVVSFPNAPVLTHRDIEIK
jgi:Ca2+-binding RTX toxin-like protein